MQCLPGDVVERELEPARRPRSAREVRRQGNLLRRAALGGLPRLEGDPVAPVVALRAAHGQEHATLRPAIDELAADAGRHPRALARCELALAVIECQGEQPLEHDVDLLLAPVGVDAPALARREADEVEPEALDPELRTQPLEALVPRGIEPSVRDPLLHGTGEVTPGGPTDPAREPSTLLRRMRRRLLPVLVVAGVLATGAAACGGNDGGGAAANTTTTAQGPQKSVRDVNVLDPANLEEKPSVAVPDGKPPTTLQKLDLVKGTGRTAHEGDKVTVQYVGVAWSTGEEFDASWDRNKPFDFTLGAGDVIQGWDRGVAGMKVGGRRVLVIPPGLGYGAQGSPPAIGKNETLVFVVDLKKVTPA